MDKLHSAEGPAQLDYYSAVLDAIKRYIRDGHLFDLTTELEGDNTSITFRFDRGALGEYMAHLDGSPAGRDLVDGDSAPPAQEPATPAAFD